MNHVEATITRIDPPTLDRDARAFVRSAALMSAQNPTGTAVFYADAWRNPNSPHVGQSIVLSRLVKTSRPHEPIWRWKALDAAPARAVVAPRSTTFAQHRTVPATQKSWFARVLTTLGLKNVTGTRATG